MEILTSIENRIEDIEETSSKLTESQKHNITIELKVADNILKRMQILCRVLYKEQ